MRLSALYRFPLKSTAGEPLHQAHLDSLGLSGDRRWMVVDAQNGRFLSQRLLPRMSLIEARWQGAERLLLNAPGMPEISVEVPAVEAPRRSVIIWEDTLDVPDAGEPAAAWLSQFLGRPSRLVQNPPALARQVDTAYAEVGDKTAFTDGFPLLLINQTSVDDLAARVGRPLEMLRFRPNLVVEGAEPYAEDRWKRIRIGELEFRLVKGCSRCIITTVDPQTGERSADRQPLATLESYRKHDGKAYFGQNLIHSGAGWLEVGMPVEVLE